MNGQCTAAGPAPPLRVTAHAGGERPRGPTRPTRSAALEHGGLEGEGDSVRRARPAAAAGPAIVITVLSPAATASLLAGLLDGRDWLSRSKEDAGLPGCTPAGPSGAWGALLQGDEGPQERLVLPCSREKEGVILL